MKSVAIFMSTYNGEKYLSKQLESIYKQNCSASICLYIRDDGSSDSTIEIINAWKDRLDIVLFQGENLGPAYSFWSLLYKENIKADYYAFCDQDDVWDPDKLAVAMKHIDKGIDLYACNCRAIDQNGDVFQTVRKKQPPVVSVECLFVSGITQGCAMVFSNRFREVLLSKKIDTVPMHDVIVLLYAMHCGEFYWDQDPHFSYRFHANNVVARKEGNPLKRSVKSIKKWKKNSKRSYSLVAKEMLSNLVIEDRKERLFLEDVSRYRSSTICKLRLITNSKIRTCEKNALRSFRLRILMNLL